MYRQRGGVTHPLHSAAKAARLRICVQTPLGSPRTVNRSQP